MTLLMQVEQGNVYAGLSELLVGCAATTETFVALEADAWRGNSGDGEVKKIFNLERFYCFGDQRYAELQ